MIWYAGAPEIQDTPLSPLSLTPQSLAVPLSPISTSSPSLPPPLPECYLGISLPLPTPSLLLPSPSLPQFSDQRLNPISRTWSFLQSFVTAASLCSKTPKLPWYSRPQLSGLAVSRENKSFDLGIDAEDPADIANDSVKHSSDLADILADYEELDDTPVALYPSWSPSLSSIALEIETFGPPSPNDSHWGQIPIY